MLRGEAEVVAHGTFDGQPSLVLGETYFYPESGGQLADRGSIGGAAIDDVRLDRDGQVHHLIRGDLPEPARLPEVGSVVPFAIDGPRRREFMALHTAQHCLSRALLDAHDAVTVSSRLGSSGCTLDVDRSGLDLRGLAETEDRINALIDEDRPVRQFFPTDQELAALSLRKPPPRTDRVRVVDVDGFDVTPCGGTHVTHTSQIGLFYLRSAERHKGGTRITFDAGPRARRQLLEDRSAVLEIATRLKCAPEELRDAVDRQGSRLAAARTSVGALRAALADQWAARLLPTEGAAPVIATVPTADPELLEAIASRLAHGTRFVALAAEGPEGIAVLFTRGPDAQMHAGALLKKVAASVGGRGGGRPGHARGRLPTGSDFKAAVEAGLDWGRS